MIKKTLILALFTISIFSLNAQQRPVNFRLQMMAGYNGPEKVPFWLRSNQYGSIPPSGASIGLIGSVQKDYDRTKSRLADWGFSAEGRFNAGNPTNFILIEGYGKLRLGIFEFKAGRVKDITGLCDTILTSGSFSISGNALGIPKIQLAIPEFYILPVFGKFFAFKGNYMHSWIGNMYYNNDTIPNSPTYVHQKTLYGRFGKPDWRLKLYGGFNHQVIWGNEDTIMGEDYALNTFQTFLYVNTGKTYNHNSIKETRVGNHLGSIDLGLSYEFKNILLFIYRQNFYDTGALYYLANILDGLNGLSIANKRDNSKKFKWKKLLAEFFYSKNQAGEVWSRWTPSRFENYYNNGYYKEGWSYRGMGLGTPLINTASSIKEGLPSASYNYFANNRIIAFHVGIEGYLYEWSFITKFSYSLNYGTFLTSASGKPFEGSIFPSPDGVFPETGQFSGYLDAKKEVKKGLDIGLTTAFDIGGLFKNSFGLMGSISKTF